MALRLCRDVQKASYYVFFLGAEEAKGLRGVNVINQVIPYLIERSQKQEPLKVTLQVSHKGIKILQESSKHFIPHSAITCSIQRDDIVACVLLLYNPTTKCPIHVHAYRCDSETTAEALHQQLQTLINRPDNQKQFRELESRLGLLQSPSFLPSSKQQKRIPSGRHDNRFVSSLSSDIDVCNNSRESEDSEEHSISPKPPSLKPKRELFDSLAAELRAKLNGNGPPLLLPPRDYDTVHRSKGNLAAIELRRCQNSMIVGAQTISSAKQVSSRGSSGIGSDLAPSPEQQDDHTSSEDDNWSNEADNSVDALKASIRHTLVKRYCDDNNEDQKDNYLKDLPSSKNNRTRQIAKDINEQNYRTNWNKEEDIHPKLVRPTHKHWEIDKNRYQSTSKDDEKRITNNFPSEYEIKQNKKAILFRNNKFQQRQPLEFYDENNEKEREPIDHKHNLTDRQKYQKSYNKKLVDPDNIQKYTEMKNQEIQSKSSRHQYYPSPGKERPRSVDRYRSVVVENDPYSEEYNNRNPYKEPESLPYRESIEKMLKSPIMRYKSFNEDDGYQIDSTNNKSIIQNKRDLHISNFHEENSPPHHNEYNHYDGEKSYISSAAQKFNSSPLLESTQDNSHKITVFKERFHETKDKFRDLQYNENDGYPPNDWSDDEQRRYRSKNSRRNGKQRNDELQMQLQSPLTSSKSLSNLVKGYRHSYAEPRPTAALPNSSGRVGLAAVNPF